VVCSGCPWAQAHRARPRVPAVGVQATPESAAEDDESP
jgi:hypothetical protein